MNGCDFEKILLQARQIDEGIAQLTELWKLPNIFIGRYSECTEETKGCVDSILNTIKTTQDGVHKINTEVEKCTLSMDQFLQEVKEEYNDVTNQCDDLETAFSDYSYKPYIREQASANASPQNEAESDLDSSEQMESIIVEFTPNMSWKQKKKLSKHSAAALNGSYKSHTEMTPRKNVTSRVEAATPKAQTQNAWCTPIREKPQDPIYSKHFYNALRK